MSSKKTNKFKNYSFVSIMKNKRKINDNFLNVLSSLTLEEIIAIKLELSAILIKNKFYNFPLWKAMPSICKDAVLRFVLSACQSKRDGARMLGIDIREFDKLLKRYNTEKLFNND
jgi:phosphoribosylaminoimidazole carboxylase (NCAIR synthetase)|tara:strand:- start:62 stop:406 length:345 start_codon:yes stop_codon:yes gene_type:complete